MTGKTNSSSVDGDRRASVLGFGALCAACAFPFAARALQGRIKPFIRFDRPRPAPMAAFLDGQGRAVNALAFYGDVVLLSFWATWCAPCVWEMPHLDRLQARYIGKGLRVAAVSEDEQGEEEVRAFYRRHEIRNLPLYLDPEGAAIKEYGWIHGLPTTYLIDRKARVVGYMDGPAEWDSPEAHRLIEALLDEK